VGHVFHPGAGTGIKPAEVDGRAVAA